MAQSSKATQRQCPMCVGTGVHDVFSEPLEPVDCAVCNGNGQVYAYCGSSSTSGGFAVIVEVVGHRELDDAHEDFFDDLGERTVDHAHDLFDRLWGSQVWLDAGLPGRKDRTSS